MDNICQKIKESLQDLYDIPFKVSCKDVFTDLVYTIIPENDLEELFYEFTAVNINGYYTGIDRVSAGQQFWSSCFVQKHF